MKTESLIRLSKASALIVVLLLSCTFTYSQGEEIITIEWQKEQTFMQGGQEIKVPSIAGQGFDGQKPNYHWYEKISKGVNYQLSFELLATQPATKSERDFLNSQYIKVGELDYHLSISTANTEKYIMLNLFPFVKMNGSVHRIMEFKIKKTPIASPPPAIQKDFVTTSVLRPGSGFWYKISVPEDGIYKIDYDFLESCLEASGIDITTIDPANLNIYGNGDGRLPELNSEPRTDDLAKNAIQIVGEGDGSFDQSDYMLFFGFGPHRWKANGALFNQDRNPYSDVSCYFINYNPVEVPLRINSVSNSTNSVTHAVSSYSYRDVHEQDAVSLVNGGQRWYGELFDAVLQRTISFNVPNIVSSDTAFFEVAIASNANDTGGTAQVYSIGGTQIFNDYLPTGSDYGRSVRSMQYVNPSSNIALTISITRDSPDILTYLDRVLLNTRRNLSFYGTDMLFSDLNSVGIGNVAEYSLASLPQTNGFVWEITDRHEPRLVDGSFVGSDYRFRLDADSLRTFVASDGISFRTPIKVGEVAYQDLHSLPQADYLIITYKSFISQAERLANLHRANGLDVHVVTTEQVYNEFSSGALDATAIKMFAKMFYDRGALDPATRPSSLLLFGDGTYDPKNRVPGNNNFVMTYQVSKSENHISALVTDDYFGLLDDNESIDPNDLLDIGVGRLLISDIDMAREQVDKIQHYMRNGSNLYSTANTNCSGDGGSTTFGDWRTRYVQIADDEENSYFIKNDVEPQFDTVSLYYPSMNCEKIYLDAYQQITTAGGQRYPEVNAAINNQIERGALVVNYVGHGGEVGVAEERVITVPQIQDWKNIDKLPLIVSATCEFTKFDDPDRVSAGEWASINPYGAAIALMTTTRSVFFGVNTDTGKSFYQNVFERDANNLPRTFGEIIRQTKNGVLSGTNNKRSFTLIGDPALRIALPRMNVITDSVNGVSPALQVDTIRALSKVTIKGHVEDFNGNPLTGFTGVLYPTVYDKAKEQMTLQNDPTSSVQTFETQTNKIYRGKASVTNGAFEFTFIVPKDINYSFDFGKLSYYAENGVTDALGDEQRVMVGGVDPNGIDDTEGPAIELYLNDESFVNGGITDETPMLLAKLFDENGINAVGNGIGHDLTAIIDAETGNPIVLNEYYSADLDSYQSGEIRYNFNELEPGRHTLTVKVWDVNNNSSESTLEFVVKENEEMSLDHVLNYPNPFTTRTEFFFEHNQVCSALEAQIQIFTVSGRLVKTINQLVMTEGFRSAGIPWDGLDDFGDQLAKGVYVYRVKVKSPEGSSDEKLEKLVILK